MAAEQLIRVQSNASQRLNEFFSSEGFVELHVPHIRKRIPAGFTPHFEVAGVDAILRSASDHFALEACKQISKVFARRLEFRDDDSAPNRLAQFTLYEITCHGTYEDAIDLTERLLRSVVDAVQDTVGKKAGLPGSSFERQSFSDLEDELRGLAFEEQMRICDKYGAPIFIENLPTVLDKDCFGFPSDGEVTRKFDLLTPFCGEVATGGELETDPDRYIQLSEQSAYSKKLADAGYDNLQHDVAQRAEQLREIGKPLVRVAFCFERSVQFSTQKQNIQDAIAFPVPTRNGGFLPYAIPGPMT